MRTKKNPPLWTGKGIKKTRFENSEAQDKFKGHLLPDHLAR